MKNFTVYANKEVILSAGAFESAHLLLLSGVGPKNELDRFNIPTISDLPVGKTLFDHVAVLLFFQFKLKPPSQTATFDEAYQYLIYRDGPLSSIAAIELGAFVNIEKNAKWPNIEFLGLFFPPNSTTAQQFVQKIESFEYPIQQKLIEVNKEYYIGVLFAIVIQPKSVGSLKLNTTSYLDHPLIDVNYLGHPDDEETMIRAVKELVSFEKTKAFRKYGGKFIKLPLPACDEYEFRSKNYYRCYDRYLSITSNHAVGEELT